MTRSLPNKQCVRRVDASHFRIVDITGADATRFLQSQFCNDQEQVNVSQALLNGYCSPKGRLLAIFVVWAIEPGYRVLIPADVMDGFVKRLRMFVLRDDVTLTPRDDLAVAGVVVHDDASHSVGIPDALLQRTVAQGCDVVHWWTAPGEAQRAILVGTPVELDTCLGDAPAPSDTSASQWRAGDIAAGIPWIRAATSEAFVPQMVNLQLLDGVSFRKGCYPGQEIVARMKYLGKLKREMRRFRMESGSLPAIGDSLTNGEDSDAAQIVDAVLDEGHVHLLAVVKRHYADGFSWQGTRLTPVPMPYALEAVDAPAPG